MIGVSLMLGLVLGMGTGMGSSVAGGDRLDQALFALRGPVSRLLLEQPGGTTEVQLALPAGEQLELALPISPRDLAGSAPAITVHPAPGQARFLQWLDPSERRQRWSEYPAGLRNRTRPPLQAPQVTAQAPALCLVLGSALLVWGLRRRPRIALLVGIGLGGATLALVTLGLGPRASQVRVLEGGANGVDAQWMIVRAGQAGLRVRSSDCLRLEGQGPEALVWQVNLAQGGRVETVHRGRKAVIALAGMDPGTRYCTDQINAWGPMDGVWTRSAEGIWAFHGPWGLGQALPHPVGEGTDAESGAARGKGTVPPPGWLSAGLPHGKQILIARLGEGAFRGGSRDSPPVDPDEACWMRWVDWMH